ncbi:response regulator transcription factor [Streptomyces sp. NPDC001380]|uniref:response regulator transcription factor n=1 Tax=Streptomyces sp. NPDC001380 TaxID=3364566 RepID=UPI00367A3B52
MSGSTVPGLAVAAATALVPVRQFRPRPVRRARRLWPAPLADGLSVAEIAAELFVGVATVRTHISNLVATSGVRSRAQAVGYAHRRGLSRRS